jgi:hypothetical protein
VDAVIKRCTTLARLRRVARVSVSGFDATVLLVRFGDWIIRRWHRRRVLFDIRTPLDCKLFINVWSLKKAQFK